MQSATPSWKFILNPSSGHVRANPSIQAQILDFIKNGHLNADIALTKYPNHATEIATDAANAGCSRVIAVGGDGTMNEVARALVGKHQTCLGIIPLGSGNGLARELGIPLQIDKALSALLSEKSRVIDTGVFCEHDFFLAAGTGIDADVALRFSKRSRRGFSAYIVDTLVELLRTRPFSYRVRTDERLVLSGRASSLVVANAAQFGNGARIAPGARVDDGVFDLVVLPPITVANAISLSWRLFRGTLPRHKHVRHIRIANCEIERSPVGVFQTDGEIRAKTGRLSCHIRPASLRIIG